MNNKLTIDELNYVQSEIKLKGKSLSISYLLLLVFGLMGIHLGYLERTKTAVLKALLTISTAALLYPITMILLEFNSNGVSTQLQQYSATFLVIAIGMIGVNIIWTMYDLVSLPSMVKEINSKIEEKFSIKAVEARYVKEKLMKEEVSQYLIEETSKLISQEIESHIELEKEKIGKEFTSIEEDLMSKREETIDLIDNVTSNLEELREMSIEFSSSFKQFNETQKEKINVLEKEINEQIESFSKESKQLIQESIIKEKERIQPVEDLRRELESSSAMSLENSKTINSEVSKEHFLSIKQAIDKGSGESLVKGYIVGNMSPNRQRVFFDYFDNEMNIAIADNPEETDRDKMIIVQLTWESGLRKDVGLLSKKENIKRPVVIKGNLVSYFKGIGMKNVMSVEMIDTKEKFISNDIEKF